jgi:4'-phosphopantetheinyl transferase EntD
MRRVTLPYSVVFVRPHPFGVLAAVRLPQDKQPVPSEVLARLTLEEQLFAREESGFRQVEIVGARLAWHAAAKPLGLDGSLLRGVERAPLPPGGVAASLTHKRDLALALVHHEHDGRLGIDLEGDSRPHTRIAEKVLRPEELARIEAMSEERKWLEVLVRFAVKEAVYKALQPYLLRYISFMEASVDVDLSKVASSVVLNELEQVDVVTRPVIHLHLKDGEEVEPLECVCEHSGARVLAAVRSR